LSRWLFFTKDPEHRSYDKRKETNDDGEKYEGFSQRQRGIYEGHGGVNYRREHAAVLGELLAPRLSPPCLT